MKILLISLLLGSAITLAEEVTPVISRKQDSSNPIHTGGRSVLPGTIVHDGDGGYSYVTADSETALPWLVIGPDKFSKAVSPNGRWLSKGATVHGTDYSATGAIDLSAGEDRFLKQEGFLGDFTLFYRLRQGEDWKELKTERQKDIHELLLLSQLTGDGGRIPGASPEEAKEFLRKLRNSSKEEDKHVISQLEREIAEGMAMNFTEVNLPLSRRFAGWINGDTALFWDCNSFRSDRNARPVVMLVDFKEKTITLPAQVSQMPLQIKSVADGKMIPAVFLVPDDGPNRLKNDFKVVVAGEGYPEEARTLMREDMEIFIEEQHPWKEVKQQLLDAMAGASKSLPARSLPY
jgi:hypothetical protein